MTDKLKAYTIDQRFAYGLAMYNVADSDDSPLPISCTFYHRPDVRNLLTGYRNKILEAAELIDQDADASAEALLRQLAGDIPND